MVQTTLMVMLATFLGFLMTAVGVALGAYCVFRTKRDSFEPFFTTKPAAPTAFNLDDGLTQPQDDPTRGLSPAEERAQAAAAERMFAMMGENPNA